MKRLIITFTAKPRSVARGAARSACAAVALFFASSWAADPTDCTFIKLGSTNWSDTIATTAMAQLAMESLSYKVKLITASQQIILAGLAGHKLDMFLGYWQPTMQPVAEPYVQKQRIQVIEPSALPDAQSTFAVPRYAYDAGLKLSKILQSSKISWMPGFTSLSLGAAQTVLPRK